MKILSHKLTLIELPRPKPEYLILIPALLLVVTGLYTLAQSPLLHAYPDLGSDWNVFMQAGRSLVETGNPYIHVPGFYNPPWLLLPLLPFTLLPSSAAFSLWFVLSFLGYGLLAYRLKTQPITLVALFLSYPVLQGLLFGQVDWLVLLGIFLPRPLGFLWLCAKPQISLGILILWLYEAIVETWHGDRMALTRLIVPTLIAGATSLALYGNWLTDNPLSTTHNLSTWPYGLIVGIPALIWALRSRNPQHALLASPFISPFLSIQSWGNILLTLPSSITILIVIADWIIRLST